MKKILTQTLKQEMKTKLNSSVNKAFVTNNSLIKNISRNFHSNNSFLNANIVNSSILNKGLGFYVNNGKLFSRRSKVVASSKIAVSDIKSGDRIMVGGFGICGVPENLLRELSNRKEVQDLHVISTNGGVKDFGIGVLMQTKQLKALTASYVGENKLLEEQYFKGEVELNLTPQGTLAEKIRAGGMGVPAFLTPTGIGTLVQEGQMPTLLNPLDPLGPPRKRSSPKNTLIYEGKQYVVEVSISADFALVKAWKADTLGNLVYRKTARNFNADMALAAKCTIAEVEEIVEAGELGPDEIHTPGIFVQRVVKGEMFEKRLENIRKPGQKGRIDDPKKARIARRAAEECKENMYINLGIGIPNLITEFIPKSKKVTVHTENGMLGVGPYPEYGKEDPDLISAIKEAVAETPGCSYFSSSESFAMVRGHHVDLTFLGAMQVDEHGNISNWIIPGKMVKGMGGAMDLVSSGGKVVVTMEHVTKNGEKKILQYDKLPFTGKGVISKVITDMGVFEFDQNGMVLKEIYHDVSLEDLKKNTDANFRVDDSLRVIDY